MGHHSTCFMEIAKNFADKNYFVHLYDQSGHGYSTGGRNMTTLEELYENFFTVLTKVRKDLPLFLFCHSMGGGSLLTLLQNNPDLKISGVIFHNPFVQMSTKAPINFSFSDRMDCALLPSKFDSFVLNGRFSAHDLGHGEKFLKRVYEDRFLLPIIGLKITRTLLRIETILKNFPTNFNYPALFLLGERDVITPMKDTHKILKKIKFKDLTIQ